MPKMNWQREMLAAFICKLISNEWANIETIYKKNKENGLPIVLHIGYDSDAVPIWFVNCKNRMQEKGYGYIVLKDEYFDPERDARMHVAYELADSLKIEE